MLQVGPYEMEMILVKGGRYMMGYDEKGSSYYDSEPVHEVQLSDYYVNKKPLDKAIVSYCLSDGKKVSDNEKTFKVKDWDEANHIVEKMALHTGLPISLISEAQWEYLATGPMRKRIEGDKIEINVCADNYSSYRKTKDVQIDPVVSTRGTKHVYRQFSEETDVYKRSSVLVTFMTSVRVTIPASAISQWRKDLDNKTSSEVVSDETAEVETLTLNVGSYDVVFFWDEDEECFISETLTEAVWKTVLGKGEVTPHDEMTPKRVKMKNIQYYPEYFKQFSNNFRELTERKVNFITDNKDKTLRLKLLD